jgi:hypothetical protein
LEWANLNIYPNPATSKLTVNSGQLKVDGIVICDLQGRTVLSLIESFVGTKTIDLSLESGTYLVRLKGVDKTYKLIVN